MDDMSVVDIQFLFGIYDNEFYIIAKLCWNLQNFCEIFLFFAFPTVPWFINIATTETVF